MGAKGLKKGTKSNFYETLGREICKAFSKQLSHPYVKLDMCPDFDNLLILTLGRFVYKFLNSKKGEKLFNDLDVKESDYICPTCKSKLILKRKFTPTIYWCPKCKKEIEG